MKEQQSAGWRWQDAAVGGGLMDEMHPQRRSAVGCHDVRLDGITDLLARARGASVFDVGCNRGHVGYEFALHGARLVHGCDIYAPGIAVARHWFAELPDVQSQFEVVDLEQGPDALKVFGTAGYDIVLFIGVYHKLRRNMEPQALSMLVHHLGDRALKLFAYNGYREHLKEMDRALSKFERVHTSELSITGRPAAIWRRRK